MDSMRDAPTTPVQTRLPNPMIEAAQSKLPGLPMSAIMRVAIARLIGVDADQFMSRLDNGPKPRNRQPAA